jgi:hypothetical protein
MDKKDKKNVKSKPTSVDNKATKKEEKPQKSNKSKDKDSDKAKKPPSGYILFGKDERLKIIKEKPELKAKEIMSEIGARWKNSSDDVKKKYNDQSAAEKDKFNKDGEKRQKSKPKLCDAKVDKDKGKKNDKKKKNADSDSD